MNLFFNLKNREFVIEYYSFFYKKNWKIGWEFAAELITCSVFMGIILGGHIFKNFSFLNCLLAGLEGSKQASKKASKRAQFSWRVNSLWGGCFEGISTGNGQVRFACPYLRS